MDLGVLKESAVRDLVLKLLFRNEMIVAAVLFTEPRRASRQRNRVAKIRHALKNFLY